MNNNTLNEILRFSNENHSENTNDTIRGNTRDNSEDGSIENFINSLGDKYDISSYESQMLLKCEHKSELRKCAIKLLEGLPYETQATMNQISEQVSDLGYPDNDRFTN